MTFKLLSRFTIVVAILMFSSACHAEDGLAAVQNLRGINLPAISHPTAVDKTDVLRLLSNGDNRDLAKCDQCNFCQCDDNCDCIGGGGSSGNKCDQCNFCQCDDNCDCIGGGGSSGNKCDQCNFCQCDNNCDCIGGGGVATPFKTLDYLNSISGQRTVAGVHNKNSRDPTEFTREVIDITGRTPGLWSGDFLFDSENIDNRWTMINEAKAQWDKGSIINIMWHSCNPALSEPCEFSGCGGTGPWSDMPDSQWDELITDGTNLNNIWKGKMDDIAQYLQFLKDNGVEVMFRPLHEMNQGCFWWGGRPGPTGTSRLYQITHDYLTNQKGLTNLIWVWNVQDFGTLHDDVNAYNPGSQYWDVASLDNYNSDGTGYAQWKHDVMVEVAGGKPVAIGECGKLPTLNDLSSQPQWTFFMSWSEELLKNNSEDEVNAVYSGEQVLTLDEMANWQNTNPVSLSNNNM